MLTIGTLRCDLKSISLNVDTINIIRQIKLNIRNVLVGGPRIHTCRSTREIIIDLAGYVLYAPQRINLAKTLVSKFERQKLWRFANKSESLKERFGNFYTAFTAPSDLDGGTKWTKFNAMDCSPDTTLEEAQYLLLPGHVLGFAMGRKEWSKQWSTKSWSDTDKL